MFAFNMTDVTPDARNLFARFGEDQFPDNQYTVGQLLIGVSNLLILIISVAIPIVL